MPLTSREKSSGRAFRERCQELISEIPAAALCSPFIPWYRHQCRDSATEGTWAMHLREHYWLSWPDGQVPAGRFAFVFRWGSCPRCGLRVRSGTGRLVLTERVPPGKGAVVREWTQV